MECKKLLRCLELVQLLQSGLKFSTKELARRFGVCKRTIFRDFLALEGAGIPITYNTLEERYIVSSGESLKLWPLQNEELILLITAIGTSELMADPGTRGSIQSAMAKLLLQTPSYLRNQLTSLANSCRLDNSDKTSVRINKSVFTKILLAISQQKYIRIRIPGADVFDKPIHTKVAPYFFSISPNIWYIVGRSSWHRRVLRLDIGEIQDIEIIDEKYTFSAQHKLLSRTFNDSLNLETQYASLSKIAVTN